MHGTDSLPSFETRRKRCGAPQDEVADVLLRFAHPTFTHSANTYSMEAGAMFLISGANP
jgi:hypothetical protein